MSAESTTTYDATSENEDWLDRLGQAYNGEQEYGFAIYHHPALLAETRLGKIRARYNLHLNKAMLRTGIVVCPFFALQTMRWPANLRYEIEALARHTTSALRITTDESSEEDSDDADEEVGDFEEDPIVDFERGSRPNWLRTIERSLRVTSSTGDAGSLVQNSSLSGRDADDGLRNIFQELRVDFRRCRDQPRVLTNGSLTTMSGYHDGLLACMSDDCFVVVDPYSAYSWWNRSPNYGAATSWVWVVDANYDEADTLATLRTNGLTEQYQGYLRVRIQQLPSTFFEAKYLRPNVTMRMLWEAARQSRSHSFVSLKPNEYNASDIVSPNDS